MLFRSDRHRHADVHIERVEHIVRGDIDEHDMFNTFNMGVGMTMTVAAEDADAAAACLKAQGIEAYRIGTIVHGEGYEKVTLI